MLNIRLLCTGNLKEAFWRDAVAEYTKRLGGMCRFTVSEFKEARLSDKPSEKEIAAALEAEAKVILPQLPAKAYKIALCVEGKELSSPELAALFDKAGSTSGEIVLVIGSSYGLSPSVKQACDLRLSVSRLTFPHQLMRVILCETIYRALNILAGTRYHK